MNKQVILDIFYNHIIKEAKNGCIPCLINYGMLFETYIEEDNLLYECDNKYKDLLIPKLVIKNKSEFNELLYEYVNLSLEFYDDNNYYPEVRDNIDYEIDKTSKEKQIMILLWSNATYSDFHDPINYLKKRISFLNNNLEYKNNIYSEYFNGTMEHSITKDKMMNETPYKMNFKLNNNGELFNFPSIKFGIYNDVVYIYAIQNDEISNNNYSKKVNRLLYKVGENFSSDLDNYDIYEEGNLKDISASFLVSLNMALSYFKKLGFTKFEVPTILITRWNAKKIALQNKIDKNKVSSDEIEDILVKQDKTQKNLTEKFIRTFLRLNHHVPSINLTNMPFEEDEDMKFVIEEDYISNNSILNETSSLISNNSRSL